MDKENPTDANVAETPSTSADANAGSSTANTQTSESEKSLLSIAEGAVADSHPPEAEGSGLSSTSTKSDDEPEQVTTEGKEAPSGAKEETSEEPSEGKEKEDLPPFHEHPRWKEIVSERNALKEQFQQLEPAANEYRKLIDYCQSNNIAPEQFRETLELAALLNRDPVAAMEKLKPIYENLSKVRGDVLPDDLRQEVEDGLITEERAKEIAQLRGRATLTEAQQRQLIAQQQQAQLVGIQKGILSWEQTMLKKDPEFRPKNSPDAPDGKYELVADRFRSLFMATPPRTVEETIALAEKAYSQVNKALARFAPKLVERKALSSNGASATITDEPQTPLEVVERVARSWGE